MKGLENKLTTAPPPAVGSISGQLVSSINFAPVGSQNHVTLGLKITLFIDRNLNTHLDDGRYLRFKYICDINR